MPFDFYEIYGIPTYYNWRTKTWEATQEPPDEEEPLVGRGATERAAVDDLLDQIDAIKKGVAR